MDRQTFLVAAIIVASTIVLVVKTIAGAFSKRNDAGALGQIKDKTDLHSAMLEEAQATLVAQSAQIAELQERLDFTERMLAQTRSRESLGPGDRNV